MVTPKYHIFVCTSCRINGTQQGFCYQKKSVDLVSRFMEEIDERELTGECMVTNTGCFGICDKGPWRSYIRKASGTGTSIPKP
jgi:predicted metal-binding protein